jgi:CRISPR-associated endonuclease Cas3-HD
LGLTVVRATTGSVIRDIATLVGLHDFGKSIPGFQAKWPEGQANDAAVGLPFSGTSLKVTDHGCASAALLREPLRSLGLPPAWIQGVSQALSAHHGYNFSLREIMNAQPSREGDAWPAARRGLFEAYWTALKPERSPVVEELSLPAVEWLAGITSVADWIASNPEWFPIGERADRLGEHFDQSKTLARKALVLIGWHSYRPLLTGAAEAEELIGRILHSEVSVVPRPLQIEGDRLLTEAQGPTLLLVEALHMDAFTIPSLSGYILDLRQLDDALLIISHREHRWWRPQTVPVTSDWISIHYSNPIYGGSLPNSLVFQFPILREPIMFFPARETTYVCLSPHLSRVVQRGPYYEGGEAKEDFLEDWKAFWQPIHEELQRRSCFAVSPIISSSREEE